jgi:5-methylcytosine-specific restriction endonuclease McrA
VSKYEKMSDAELDAEVDRLGQALCAAQAEIETRFVERLMHAYGHEARYVDDPWSGARRGANGRPEIVWCFYCGERPGWQDEHKIPRARGGRDHPSNIVPACRTCNRRKGIMTIEEYRASIEAVSGAAHAFAGERKARP